MNNSNKNFLIFWIISSIFLLTILLPKYNEAISVEPVVEVITVTPTSIPTPTLAPTPTCTPIPTPTPEPTPTPTPASIYAELIDNLTDYEKELICRITVRECIDQDVPGQRAVIEVILNRVISDAWPNTVEGVLSQGSKTGVLQFATWPIKHWAKEEEIEAMMETLELVRTSADLILPHTDYVYFATKEQSYAKNYIAIQDHHFGTELNSSFDLEEWLKHNELTN